MSEELNEGWVPEVAQRKAAVERPDQEWVPGAVFEGFEHEGGEYVCRWCAARVRADRAELEAHRALHERPDQEWVPGAAYEGFEHREGWYHCQWCGSRVRADRKELETHRATHT